MDTDIISADKELRRIGMSDQGHMPLRKTLLKKRSSNEKINSSLRKEEK
jgi:hypothetical protein